MIIHDKLSLLAALAEHPNGFMYAPNDIRVRFGRWWYHAYCAGQALELYNADNWAGAFEIGIEVSDELFEDHSTTCIACYRTGQQPGIGYSP